MTAANRFFICAVALSSQFGTKNFRNRLYAYGKSRHDTLLNSDVALGISFPFVHKINDIAWVLPYLLRLRCSAPDSVYIPL